MEELNIQAFEDKKATMVKIIYDPFRRQRICESISKRIDSFAVLALKIAKNLKQYINKNFTTNSMHTIENCSRQQTRSVRHKVDCAAKSLLNPLTRDKLVNITAVM